MAANDGFPPAMVALGTVYRDGSVVERDMPEAIAWDRRASALGDNDATTNLARIHIEGDEVEPDPAEGLALLAQAIDQGSARAPLPPGTAAPQRRACRARSRPRP